MRFVSSTISLLLACVVALSACAGSSAPADDPAALAPADSPLYFEFTTQPNAEQKATLESLIARFSGLAGSSAPQDLDQAIQDLLDQASADSGVEISYADDIQSWLGQRAGFAITSIPAGEEDPPVSVAFESTDDDAAQAFIDKTLDAAGSKVETVKLGGVEAKRTSDGAGAVAVDDGYVVIGSTDQAFTSAVEAVDGDSLADQDRFGSFADLPADNFASAYIDVKQIVEQSADVSQEQLDAINQIYKGAFDEPISLSLSATEDSIAVDASSGASFGFPAYEAGRIEKAPTDALAALSFGDIGEQISTSLDQLRSLGDSSGQGSIPDESTIDGLLKAQTGFTLTELENTLGAGDIYVQGDFPNDYLIGFQVAIKGDSSDLIGRIGQALAKAGLGSDTKLGKSLNGGEGLSITGPKGSGPSEPRYVNVSLNGDEASVLISPSKAAIIAGDTGSLSDSQTYGESLRGIGDGFEPVLFADLGAILDAVDKSGSVNDATGQQVLDTLKGQLSYFAVGSASASDSTAARYVIGLTPAGGS